MTNCCAPMTFVLDPLEAELSQFETTWNWVPLSRHSNCSLQYMIVVPLQIFHLQDLKQKKSETEIGSSLFKSKSREKDRNPNLDKLSFAGQDTPRGVETQVALPPELCSLHSESCEGNDLPNKNAAFDRIIATLRITFKAI